MPFCLNRSWQSQHADEDGNSDGNCTITFPRVVQEIPEDTLFRLCLPELMLHTFSLDSCLRGSREANLLLEHVTNSYVKSVDENPCMNNECMINNTVAACETKRIT